MNYNTKDIVVKLETSYDISDSERTSIAAIGSHMTLGNWDENRPLLAINTIGNQWEIYISARAGTRIYWKWVIYDLRKRKVLLWEDKIDVRELVVPFNDSHIIVPWNKAQNIPLSLCDGPSCDPYEIDLIKKFTARGDKKPEQASTCRFQIENPRFSQPKIAMPYLANLSVGNNDYISLFQALSTKYGRQKTAVSSTMRQEVQEPNTVNSKMARKVPRTNLNVSTSKYRIITEVQENGNTFKNQQKGPNPNHSPFQTESKGNSTKMSGDYLKLKISLRDKLSRTSDRKRSKNLQRRTRFTACRQSKSLKHDNTRTVISLDKWHDGQGFAGNIGNPIVGVLALCVVCYSIYTKLS
ncbi:hypothetical protein CHS0354_015315 [Potamilus streckersoni]|uniref:CBM20 domain-containing protein n=1 Tax=Potamilus streckersoni TaxID=2493646 RepID=A0AAE0W722_9BIVA|nr:hypothetical protein CHS0354_015315 [Potamilus streckersoni]